MSTVLVKNKRKKEVKSILSWKGLLGYGKISLNADISETKKDNKKGSMVFFPVFPVLSYRRIKIFTLYPLYGDFRNRKSAATPNFQTIDSPKTTINRPTERRCSPKGSSDLPSPRIPNNPPQPNTSRDMRK